MGLAEAMGMKTVQIQTKEKLDIEGFYNKIKDVEFEAGVSGMKSTFGEPKKQCMAQVDEIAEKIKALNL